jgi:capsular exopolysaccharide synthesis family protein
MASPSSNRNRSNAPQQALDFDIREIFRILWKRRGVIVFCVIGCLALALLSILFATSLYTASATVRVDRYSPDILNFRDIVGVDPMAYREFSATQCRVIESHAVVEIAADRLDLAERPELLEHPPTPFGSLKRRIVDIFTPEDEAEEETPHWDELAVAYIGGGVSATPIRGTSLLRVSFTDRDPEVASEIANEVARAFQQHSVAAQYQLSDQASEFLTKEVARLQGELASLEGSLQDLGDEREIVGLSEGTQNISEKALSDLYEQLTVARTQLAVRKAHWDEVQKAEPNGLPEVLSSRLLQNLRQDYATLERKHSQMSERFKSGWPALAELTEELNQAARRLESETDRIAGQVVDVARTEFESASGEVGYLQEQIDLQKLDVRRVNREAIDYSGLRAEIETRRKVLQDIVARQSETETTGQLRDSRSGSVQIVEEAETPVVASYPRKDLNLALALIAGLGLGIGSAFLLHTIDNTVKSESDIQRYAEGVALLGHIPSFEALRLVPPEKTIETQLYSDFASYDLPNSAFAEAFKNLRTSLLLASPGHPPRTIMVTSAQPGDGKSTSAMNLAVVLSQLGRKVLLIDADLRRPRIHLSLGISPDDGVSSYLSGNTTADKLIHETRVPGLSVMVSGPIPPNPSELLDSPDLDRLLADERLAGFDHIIVDAPPTIQVADSMILAPRMQATLLVVRSHTTTRESLTGAVTRLRHARAKLTGIVFNDVMPLGQEYSYTSYHDGPVRKRGAFGLFNNRLKRGRRQAG